MRENHVFRSFSLFSPWNNFPYYEANFRILKPISGCVHSTMHSRVHADAQKSVHLKFCIPALKYNEIEVNTEIQCDFWKIAACTQNQLEYWPCALWQNQMHSSQKDDRRPAGSNESFVQRFKLKRRSSILASFGTQCVLNEKKNRIYHRFTWHFRSGML